MSSANEVALVDAVYGTNLNTRATAGAERIIDSCEIILYGDCTVGAGLLTLHTAYTAVGAILTGESTLIVVGALNNYAGGVVDKVNDAVGTLTYADATADTLLGIDFCHGVLNGDSTLRTNLNAVAVAKTSIGAEFISAVRHVSGKTGSVPLEVVLSGSGIAGTVAGNVCYLLNNVCRLNSKKRSNLLCGVVAAGDTEVGLVGSLFCKSLCVAVAAAVAARTAVGTGKAVTDSNCSLILLDTEEYAGYCKKSRANYCNTDEE